MPRVTQRNRLSRRVFIQQATRATAVAALLGSGMAWWRPFVGHSSGGGVSGQVLDILSGKPVPGAIVSLGSGRVVAVTDAGGRYLLALPSGSHELRITAPGYLDVARAGQTVLDGVEQTVDFDLLLARPSPEQEEETYAKVVHRPEAPLVVPPSASDAVSPADICVPNNIVVRWSDGSQTTMPLDEYLRHVVPAEVPASWPTQALYAQAVAARSYAVAYSRAYGYICATTSCQYYGANTYASTDAAVSATHGTVATYNNAVIWAFFFAQCNGVSTRNSEQAFSNTAYGTTCTVGGWNYVAYCRARTCTGHAAYNNSCGYHGHGVGMCQWGLRDLANQGLNWNQILARYYTGIQLYTEAPNNPPQLVSPGDGYLAQAGTALTLSWSGTSSSYTAIVSDSLGNVVRTQQSTTTQTVVSGLAAGTYYWYVVGNTDSCSDGASAPRRFVLADPLFRHSLYGVSKG